MQPGFRLQQQLYVLHRREWRPPNDSNNQVSGIYTQPLLKPCFDFPQLLDDPCVMLNEGHSLHLNSITPNGWHESECLPVHDIKVFHSFLGERVRVRTRVVQVVKHEIHSSTINRHHQLATEHGGLQNGPWLMKGPGGRDV